MGYQWSVFVHIAGVFAFLVVHGVSIVVALRLRNERDPVRINALLDLSGRTVLALYLSLAVLLAGGIAATFLGDLWGFGWIWAAIITLVVVTMAMYFMARPYYQRVRFITRAVAEGSKAVTPEQFDSVLRARRPVTVTWIGFAGLAFILYLMIMKPTLGLTPSPRIEPTAAPGGVVLRIEAVNSRFSQTVLNGPAGQAFSISFRNSDSGIPHDIRIHAGSSAAAKAVFVGEQFAGPATRLYKVPALSSGRFFFVCTLHPTTMTGTLTTTPVATPTPTGTPTPTAS